MALPGLLLNRTRRGLALDPPRWTLIGVVAATLTLHIVVAATTSYGLHRDELLYLAQGRHLDWGFLEVPPLIAALGRILQETIGTSVVAVRLFPALAGAALVLLTGLMTRMLGGEPFVIGIAGLCVLIGPVYLRTHTLFQPVPFDQLWWTLAAFFLMLRIARADRRYWLLLGLICGVGLLTKYSILVFGAGILGGVLLTPLRRDLATPWPWLAALIAFAIATPNITWQARHGWPLLAHAQALAETQLVYVSRMDFLIEQVLMLHPFTLPVWGLGLAALFRRWNGAYRTLGWTFVACLGLFLILGGKPYYLAPAYPMLFAAGAVAVSTILQRRPLRIGFTALLLAGGLALSPMGVPVLSPPAMAHYLDVVGLSDTVRDETGQPMPIPQDYADMLGWREQAAAVAEVYRRLPPADREETMIVAENYGEAGAIDLYGPDYGLPPAISASGSYYLWGPSNRSGRVAIVIGIPSSDALAFFERCTDVGPIRHDWAREHAVPLLVCRNPHRTLYEVWPTLSPW
jgi:hypothetical protein